MYAETTTSIPHARSTAIMCGRYYAKHFEIEGGAPVVHTVGKNDEDEWQRMFYFDTNEVDPAKRYRKEWQPLADALQLTAEPRWYLAATL